ncbi:helix-turn-helix transcriptional regulator [Desulfotruncus alcoholivorax]|uniref:helix-turn-helix transcriptional regulator n=1 Tax=Desulfotruncus alcoholivorax TaxID=265477 RepID=UPI0003FCFB60|nr:helix-turn-helix domain-containing protein [Desulfotruncus alcoholivorax]
MPHNQAAKKKRGRPQKNIDLARVFELLQAGKTDREIAAELDVSVRTFRSFRKKYNIPPAAGHGGARRGAGRKKFTCGTYDPYMERQQAIDAKVNSIDAGLRVGKRGIYKDGWLRLAGSAYEYDKSLGQYTSKIPGCGIPAAIKAVRC